MVRVANLWWMSDHPIATYQLTWGESDMAAHWAWSQRILDGDLLGRDTYHPSTSWMQKIAPAETWERWRGGKQVFDKAPLYPYLLAAFRRVGGDSVWGFGLGQLTLGLANVALIFLLAERFFGPSVATLAGLGAALYGPFLLHETLVLRDVLGVTVSLLMLWGLSRTTDARPGPWILAGLFFALALLGRELTALFAPFVVLWTCERFWRRWRTLGVALLSFAGGVMLGLLPLVARNLAVGAPPWALSGLGIDGIIYGHAVDALPAGFDVPRDTAAILRQADGRFGEAIRLTLDTYHGDWGKLATKQLARTAAILASHEPSDNVNWYYFLNRWPLLRCCLRYEFVLALGLVGLWLGRGSPREHRLLAYFLLVSLAGLQYTAVIGRYRLVPAAVLLIYSGVTLQWLSDAFRARRWVPALTGTLAILVLLVVSINLTRPFASRYRYRSEEFFMAGEDYLRRGEAARAYEEARAGLESAYAGPDQHRLPRGYPRLALLLVHAAQATGRTADAATLLERLAVRYDADQDLKLLAQMMQKQAGGA